MNPTLFIMAAVAAAGAATALQAPINARLAGPVGSTVNAAFVSFAVGTVALGVLAMAMQTRPDVAALKAMPLWTWTGGLCGVIFVLAATWGVPRLGVATTITLMVAGQLVLALLLDHFGAFGVERQPINLLRILGVAMVFAGVVLVRRG